MLSRLTIKPKFNYYLRYLCDKPSDKNDQHLAQNIFAKDELKKKILSPTENEINCSEIEGKTNKHEDPKIPQKTQEQDQKVQINLNSYKTIQEILKSMTIQPKLTESEYEKNFTMAQKRDKKPKEVYKIKKIEEDIIKAASDVAKTIGGNPEETEAELLSKVLGKIDKTSTSLSDLISEMKVDTSNKDVNIKSSNRGSQVKELLGRSSGDQAKFERVKRSQAGQQQRDPFRKRGDPIVAFLDIYSGKPLNIFSTPANTNYGTKLEVWDRLNDREVTLATAQPPRNYFEKMILWTEQGKVWKFPINNEQGMEEEQNVPFTEHIFLDAHLESWCPRTGPIRHFMELVCVGLSKNAFYTVQEKKDHIMWYKEYFESKKHLLIEVGAWETTPAEKVST